MALLEDILDRRILKILDYLSDGKVANKSEISGFVKNWLSIDKILDKMEKEGLISVKEQRAGGWVYHIQITPKGAAFAAQLKKADQLGKQGNYEMPPDFDKEFEGLSAMTHLNVLDDHIAITEHNYDGTGRDRVVMVYVKLNGRGFMRLWCEVDDAYECRHTRYAWTLPSVQEMVQIQRDKGNMKE